MGIIRLSVCGQVVCSFLDSLHYRHQRLALKRRWQRQAQHGEKRWSDVYQPHSRGYTAAGEEFSRQLKNQRYLDGLVVEKNPVHALAVSAQGLAMIGHH